MLKRLLLIVAMGAALAACNPSNPGSSVDGVGSPAASDSVLPSDSAMPSASDMLEVSPSP